MNKIIKRTDFVLEGKGFVKVEVSFAKKRKGIISSYKLTPTFDEVLQNKSVLKMIQESDAETLSDVTIAVRSENEGKCYKCDLNAYLKDKKPETAFVFIKNIKSLSEEREDMEKWEKKALERDRKLIFQFVLIAVILVGTIIACIWGDKICMQMPHVSIYVIALKLGGPLAVFFGCMNLVTSIKR